TLRKGILFFTQYLVVPLTAEILSPDNMTKQLLSSFNSTKDSSDTYLGIDLIFSLGFLNKSSCFKTSTLYLLMSEYLNKNCLFRLLSSILSPSINILFLALYVLCASPKKLPIRPQPALIIDFTSKV